MMARPPLRIKTDSQGIQQITFDSIGIEWDTIWYEWYDETEDRWFSKWPGENGTFTDLSIARFGGETAQNAVQGLDNVRAFINDPTIPIRRVDVNIPATQTTPAARANYQVHVVLFDEMARRYPNVTEYEDYLHEINNDHSVWTDISVRDADTTTPYFIIENLEENTAYVVFVRPYLTLDGQRMYAYFPNFVMATTLTNRPPIDITPTIPFINLHEITDQTATLRW